MRTLIKSIKITSISLFILIGLTQLSFAADCPPTTESKRYDQFEVKQYLSVKDCASNAEGEQKQAYFSDKKNEPIISFILTTIEFLTKIAGSIAFLIIVIAGIMMISGHEEYINKAKEMMQSAVIGLVFVFSSYIIVIFVESLFY